MKVAYHQPSLDTIYAQRTVYNGFKHAFTDLGHVFLPFTANDNLETFLDQHQPDIFLTSSHFYYRKFLDFQLLKKYRAKGMTLVTKIDFWNSPMAKFRINEASSMKNDRVLLDLLQDNLLGDFFYHVVEQDDPRMSGFQETTGATFFTLPLAADATVIQPRFDKQFATQISYVGTNLPQKKAYFDELLFPLQEMYDVRLYGQDWTATSKALGWIQRVGQYFNLPFLRSLQKPKLQLTDESSIYTSSLISVNIHEDYQRFYGGDCNERSFKIPLAGGFEVVDDVACLARYFNVGEEIVVASDTQDWFEKIEYYVRHPEEREKIIKKGQARVRHEHTYHHRVKTLLKEIGKDNKDENKAKKNS